MYFCFFINRLPVDRAKVLSFPLRFNSSRIAMHFESRFQELRLFVASGSLHPGSVPHLMEVLGKDFVIQAGGGMRGHRGGTISDARAIRQAVDATIRGITLDE